MATNSRLYQPRRLELASVLVVDDDPDCRLALQTVLQAGGYRVDSAATAAEAVGKMDDQEYDVVLSDMQMESPEAGLKVLAHAQMMEYQPATALVTKYREATEPRAEFERVQIETEDIPGLLTEVADLLAKRVSRIVGRELRLAQSEN